MAFQKCPLCEGKMQLIDAPCRVCQDKGVIDEKTGRPPHTHEALETIPAVNQTDEEIVKELSKFVNPLSEMTDDEILYWATPHYDEIQKDKEAHQKKIEEEKNGEN